MKVKMDFKTKSQDNYGAVPKYVWLGLFVLIVVIPVYAMLNPVHAATLSDYNNTKSGTNLYPHLNVSESIRFNASCTGNSNLYWWINGVNTTTNSSTSYANYTTSWSSPGHQNVSVYCDDGTNSALLTWIPWIEQQMATAADAITQINTTAYDRIFDEFNSDTPNYEIILGALPLPAVSLIGNLFYVLLYGAPFIFIWLGQESAKVPATLGIIMGTVLLGSFAPEYIGLSVLMIILTFFGLLYTLYKQRG